MADALAHLYAAITARPADGVVGWRAGVAICNAQFLARVQAWHALLRAQGGKQFALYLDDSVEFAAALLGAWHAAKTIWLSADALPATVASLTGMVDGFLGQFSNGLQPPTSGDTGTELVGADLPADFPALVVFTSGSTGAPEAIRKKLAQLASEVATLERLFGAAAGAAAVFATVSHQHIYGLLFKVLWPLCSARPLHALRIAYPGQLALDLAGGPCVLVTSPAYLKRLPEHLDWRGAARMLRAVFSSGGPLTLDVAVATGAMLGQAPLEVYGSSETGGIAWRQRGAGSDDAWLPFPAVEWRLAGVDGTLEVRSPHLFDANWLMLADCAAAVDARRFLLLGRNDRIVKIEEKRVSLTAMEAALAASGLVIEVRVVPGAPVPGQRSTLAVFAVPAPDGRRLLDAAGKAALNARLRAVLASVVDAVALPRRWHYLDQMPVDAQGKTSLAALLALAR